MNLAETIKRMGQPLEEKKPPFDVSKADYAGAAKELTQYAKTKGGMDKDDFLSFANRMAEIGKRKSPKVMAKFARDLEVLDTSPREKIISVMRNNGIKVSYKGNNMMIEEHDATEWEELDEAMVRGKEVFDKTFANRTQADNFAKKNGGKVRQVGRVFYVFKESPEDDMPASMDEKSMALRQAEFIQYVGEEIEEFIEKEKPFPEWLQNKLSELHTKAEDVHSAMAGEYKDGDEEELDEAKRNPSKSGGTGYDLYHKDFSSAMKHAYDYAKNKLGVEIDPKEIDDKVASGPRKPSKGKTNTYRLMGKDGKKGVQIQVANLDDKKFELNMYKEEVELDELKKYDKNKDYQLLNRLSQKAKTGKLTPSEKSQMANAKARLRNHGFSEEIELDEDFYNVIYRDKKGKVQGEKEFDSKSAAEKYAKLGNSRDKVGGKYTVTLVRDGGMGRRKEEVELDESVDFDAMFEGSFEEPKLSLEDTLQAIWEGKKLDPVNKNALKKDFDDRKDKDLDNDGDVDDSDEYLHKRRKAVSKAVSSDKAEAENDKEVSDKEDEPKGKIGKSNKQTKVDVNPSIEEEKGEEMTSAEMEKRDEIMKSLEKKKDEFVKKYGDRAKEVMARTAIKMAKKHA